jgi:hypothetical protein
MFSCVSVCEASTDALRRRASGARQRADVPSSVAENSIVWREAGVAATIARCRR